MLLGLIAIVCTLLLVVGIHEAGHAWVARFFGVKIKRITIGFGKPLFIWTRASGVEWAWAIWPLGGSVSLLNTRVYPVDVSQYNFCFDKKPIWQRICILLAGSLANIITAWLAFVLVFMMGIHYRVPIVASVQANSIAAKAGIAAGDQFIAIGGEPIISWREVGVELVELWGQSDVVVTLREPVTNINKVVHLDLKQVAFNPKQASLLSSLGINPDKQAPKALLRYTSVVDAISYTNKMIGQMLYLFLMTLKQIIIGIIPFAALLGPLVFFSEVIATFMQGVVVFLYFIASLSVAVALINLLPIPVLDGGSIIYALIEKIRKQPVSVALEILIHRLFLIGFCVLLVHLVTNDLLRYYS